jgi:hypothetical protein
LTHMHGSKLILDLQIMLPRRACLLLLYQP